MSRIISYRGLIADGEQQQIALQTNNGLKGYRIVKLDVITENPGTTAYEHIIKIYKTEQSAVTADINFSDNRLLGCAFTKGDELTYRSAGTTQIVFDNEKFNQDIFITHVDTKDALACNYYIELEQMDLSLDEQTVATLKDIRNTGTQ